MRAVRPLIERLRDSYTVAPSGCWEWTRSLNEGGYSTFDLNGQRTSGHRAAYTLLVGAVPDGLDLDHLCRNRKCVNPAHLEPVTRQENLLRSPLVGKWRERIEICPQGHPYDESNTYYRTERSGRECRECRRAARLRHYHRKAAA